GLPPRDPRRARGLVLAAAVHPADREDGTGRRCALRARPDALWWRARGALRPVRDACDDRVVRVLLLRLLLHPRAAPPAVHVRGPERGARLRARARDRPPFLRGSPPLHRG